MAALIRESFRLYNKAMTVGADPRTKEWFLAGSPVPMIVILVIYYFFVTKWGPWLMKHREPCKIDSIIQIYNLLQVATCGYLALVAFTEVYGPWGRFTWYCEPVSYDTSEETMKVVRHMYIYYMLKYIDLLDTVFFILRKKQSHVTFLHVYHHVMMVFVMWMAVTFVSGGHATYMPSINCVAHTVMYSYYFLANLFKNNAYVLKFKKFVTQVQLLQFLSLCVQGMAMAILAPDCNFPILVVLFCYPQNLFMVVMFTDFYIKKYIRPQRAAAKVKGGQ